MRRVVQCSVAILAIAAVSGSSPAQPGPQAPQARGRPTRVFAKGSWNLLWEIGADSDLLLRPELIATAPGRAVVFDYGDNTVKSIRLGKGLEWRIGGRGQGPAEFLNPTSLAVNEAGETLVLDPQTARLTVISASGKLVRTIPLEQPYEQVAMVGRQEAAMVSYRRDTIVAFMDTTGRLRRPARAPGIMKSAQGISREAAGVVSTRNGLIVGFRWASVMFEFDRQGNLIHQCMGVDSLSFPPARANKVTMGGRNFIVHRVDPKGIEAVAAIAVTGGQLAVLRSLSEDRRVLDVYAADCGPYRESRLFPYPAPFVAGIGDSIVALINEPTPHLAVLQWKRAKALKGTPTRREP